MKTRRIVFALLIIILSITIFSSCKEKTTEPTWNTVATPVFDPPGGTYLGSQTVTIACETLGVTIYYTLDGSNPNSASPVYSSPITISQNLTIKAKAFRDGWSDSPTASAVYTIQTPINFVYVPGGTFHNGTSNVTVSSFYMDKYELTQAGYAAVMGAWDSDPFGWGIYGIGSDYPVYYVSWFNAIEYCNRRSLQEGLTPCFSYSTYGTNPDSWPSGWNTSRSNHSNVVCNWTANGYRLPTEAEWQFAARGGNQTHNYTYSGSNDINAVAWYDGNNSPYGTKPVGTKAPNELGIYDMTGNVWEWTWDIYGDYPSASQTNPTGANSGSDRVLRGGGWGSDAGYCAVSYRFYAVATFSYVYIGFRCVRVSL